MEEEEEDFIESTFEIMINEDDDTLIKSYLLENDQIKFPNAGFEIGPNGINAINDPNCHYSKIKIQTKNIQEKEVLGKGSAGIVRRAIYIHNDREYIFAVKEINASEKQNRKQLVNDLRQCLTGKPSEYLIQFYTCYFQNGLVKQVIEYMDMGTLRNIISLVSKKVIHLNEKEIAEIIFKVLKGLDHIHNVRHSIHRDIKPENILLNSRGEIKITDFGVSTSLEKSHGTTRGGTYTYMSPERLSMNSMNHTCKSDIWSLGLMFFELATGRILKYLAKDGNNYFKVMQKILNQTPPEFEPHQFSQQMCDFLNSCLKKNQKERASVQELLEHVWIKQNANKINFKDVIENIQKVLVK